MTNAQFIFNALTKQDMTHVVALMKENKTMSLNNAINYLFEVINVYGEDCIFERGYNVSSSASYASHVRQCSADTYTMYDWDNIDEIPF